MQRWRRPASILVLNILWFGVGFDLDTEELIEMLGFPRKNQKFGWWKSAIPLSQRKTPYWNMHFFLVLIIFIIFPHSINIYYVFISDQEKNPSIWTQRFFSQKTLRWYLGLQLWGSSALVSLSLNVQWAIKTQHCTATVNDSNFPKGNGRQGLIRELRRCQIPTMRPNHIFPPL